MIDTEEIKGFAYRMLEDGLMEIPSADQQQVDGAALISAMSLGYNYGIKEDRPQGEWIRTAGEYIGDDVSGFYDYHWACSECEKEAIINEWNIYELSDYCPHCGAKMKGTDDGNK